MWPVEEIPDVDGLYMRVHRNHVRDGEPIPGAFRDIGGGMSTDWNKYSTPQATRERGRKDPALYGIIQLPVGLVRTIDSLAVTHSPLEENRAHTDVIGEKDTEVRLKLLRVYEWKIPLAEVE